jgi:hypothetical protein
MRKGNGRRPELSQQSACRDKVSRNRKTNQEKLPFTFSALLLTTAPRTVDGRILQALVMEEINQTLRPGTKIRKHIVEIWRDRA